MQGCCDDSFQPCPSPAQSISRSGRLRTSHLEIGHTNHGLDKAPNAAPQPLPEAEARHECRLEAVGCRRLFGLVPKVLLRFSGKAYLSNQNVSKRTTSEL